MPRGPADHSKDNGELVQVGIVSYTSGGRDHFTRVPLGLEFRFQQSYSPAFNSYSIVAYRSLIYDPL